MSVIRGFVDSLLLHRNNNSSTLLAGVLHGDDREMRLSLVHIQIQLRTQI